MKFDHVAVNAADIARSVAWYRSALGAEVLYEDPTWALLQAGGRMLFELGAFTSQDTTVGAYHNDDAFSLDSYRI